MNLFNRLLRNLINLVFCCAAVTLCLGLAVLMLIANYLACQVSFELLGYDKQPLNADKLIGQLFDAFFPKAALTHLYAFVVAALVSLGLFLCFRVISHIFELYKERRHYLNTGDQQSARIINQLICWDLVELVAFAIPLTAAVYWDVQLFRFRSICGAAGIEDAETATSLNAWPLQLSDNGTLWAWSLTAQGAWGYIGVTALSALAFEYTLRKTSENWAKLLSTFDEILTPAPREDAQASIYGYDQHGQPVYDPQAPIAYDVNGAPLHDRDPAFAESDTGTESNEQPASTHRQHSASRGASQDTAAETSAAKGPLFESPSPGRDAPGEGGAAAGVRPETRPEDLHFGGRSPGESPRGRTEEAPLHEVIGGADGERVSLSEALRHPDRYWVDSETHEVWDAHYRRALFGEEMSKAA